MAFLSESELTLKSIGPPKKQRNLKNKVGGITFLISNYNNKNSTSPGMKTDIKINETEQRTQI